LTGEVFIVTKGGRTLRIGLVEVRLIPAEVMTPFVMQKLAQSREAIDRLRPALEAADAAWHAALDDVERVKALYEQHLQDAREAAAATPTGSALRGEEYRRAQERWRQERHWAEYQQAASGRRLAEAREQAVKREKEYRALAADTAAAVSPEYYFAGLPTGVASVKTDADGKFRVRVATDKRYALAARSSGGAGDAYFWLFWVGLEGKSSKQLLVSNDTLFGVEHADGIVQPVTLPALSILAQPVTRQPAVPGRPRPSPSVPLVSAVSPPRALPSTPPAFPYASPPTALLPVSPAPDASAAGTRPPQAAPPVPPSAAAAPGPSRSPLPASYHTGLAKASARDWAGAERAYRDALLQAPNRAEVWYRLAMVLGEQKQPAHAVAAYRQAVTLNPDLVEAWYGLGVESANRYDYPAARAAFREVTRLQPANHEAWRMRGRLHALNREYLQAITALQEAIRLKPDDALAWYELGAAHALANSRHAATEVYNRLMQMDPEKAKELREKYLRKL
jgi:tetratricopeptide (TPR) repeat protein